MFIVFGIFVLFITLYNFFISCYLETLSIVISTKGGSPAIEIFSQTMIMPLFLGGRGTKGVAEVLPWKDTDLAMEELGTIIEDMQRDGKYALEKWGGISAQ